MDISSLSLQDLLGLNPALTGSQFAAEIASRLAEFHTETAAGLDDTSLTAAQVGEITSDLANIATHQKAFAQIEADRVAAEDARLAAIANVDDLNTPPAPAAPAAPAADPADGTVAAPGETVADGQVLVDAMAAALDDGQGPIPAAPADDIEMPAYAAAVFLGDDASSDTGPAAGSDQGQRLADRLQAEKSGDFNAGNHFRRPVMAATRYDRDLETSVLQTTDDGFGNRRRLMRSIAAFNASEQARRDGDTAQAAALAERVFTAKAAAFCGPPQYDTEIRNCVDKNRYLRLTEIPAGNGQFRIAKPTGTVADETFDWSYGTGNECPDGNCPEGVVDKEDPTSVDSDADKGCAPGPECQLFDDYALEAQGWCMTVDRSTDIGNADGLADRINSIEAGAARSADAKLMGQMISKAVSNDRYFTFAGTQYNAADTLYTAVSRMFEGINADQRTSLAGYVPIVHQSFKQHVGREKWMSCGSDGCTGEADAVFNDLGLGPVMYTPDWARPAAVLDSEKCSSECTKFVHSDICGNPVPKREPAAAGDAIDLGGDNPLECDARCYDIIFMDPNGVAKMVGRRQTLGMTGPGGGSEFRDWSLTRKNKRGIFVEWEESLIASGCDPLLYMKLTIAPKASAPGCSPACGHPLAA